MSDLNSTAEVVAIAAAFTALLGSPPNVSLTDSGGIVSFSPDQATKIQNMMQSTSGGSNNVQVDLLPVVLPVIVKMALPWVLGIVALGVVIGRQSKKRR